MLKTCVTERLERHQSIQSLTVHALGDDLQLGTLPSCLPATSL